MTVIVMRRWVRKGCRRCQWNAAEPPDGLRTEPPDGLTRITDVPDDCLRVPVPVPFPVPVPGLPFAAVATVGDAQTRWRSVCGCSADAEPACRGWCFMVWFLSLLSALSWPVT